MFVTGNRKEADWALEIGITVNNFYVVDGVLKSVISNDLVIDENGRLMAIPSNVREIAEGAFYNISGLKEVSIPGSVKVIGNNAFAGNKELTKLNLENGIEVIGEHAFNGCTSLTSINLPDSVKEIKKWAFANCSNLQDVRLSNNIEYIADFLFYSDLNLENIDIPNMVTSVGKSAFTSCKNLVSVNIPASVTLILDCFGGCDNLMGINVDVKNESYKFENGMLISRDNTQIIKIIPSALNSDSLIIPEGVTNISQGMIPKNIVITRVELPSTVTNIDTRALNSNSRLNELVVSDKNVKYKTIDGNLYSKNGETLHFWIGKDTTITVPAGVKKIAGFTFLSCSRVTSIYFPDSLTTISDHALNGLTNVVEIDIGVNVSNIYPLAFGNTGIRQVNIDPANEYYTFSNNAIFSKDMKVFITLLQNIENYEIPRGVEKIENYAFYQKTKLKNIVIPDTVKVIGMSFHLCYELASIDIPSSVDSIDSRCFENCNKLKKVNIYKAKGSIEGSPWGVPYGEKALFWLGK